MNTTFCLVFLFSYIINFTHCEEYYEQPIYFKEEEVRHIRDLSLQNCIEDAKKYTPCCEDDVLVNYLAEFQVITPESIIGIPIADFDSACRTLESNLKKIRNFSKTCKITPGLYYNLIQGIKTLDQKLCRDAKFYATFERYYQCFHDLDKDYDSCDGPPDWNEGEDKPEVCKTYKTIIDCYFIKTAKVCGKKGARILKELMTETIDCTLNYKCNIKSDPHVEDVMPEKYMNTMYKSNGILNFKFWKLKLAVVIIIPFILV